MPTVGELFALYQRDILADKAPSYQYNMAKFLGQVLRAVGDVPLEALTSERLRTWKLELTLRHAPSTVHRYFVRLEGVLRVAVEEYGWLPANPLRTVRRPARGRGRVRFLSPDERTRLLTACQASRCPLILPLVVVALATGGRRNELRRLQWSHVDLAAGVVRFLHTKTHLDRAVPLVGDARGRLAALAARRAPGIPWVFPSSDGQRPRDLTDTWRRVRQQAGLVDVRFHDLRHTFASYMAMSGASLRDIAEVLGHASISQTVIYTHLMPSHTRRVVEQMHQQFLS